MNNGLKTISNVLKESFITLKNGDYQREKWHSASRDRPRRVDPDLQLKKSMPEDKTPTARMPVIMPYTRGDCVIV